jgi:hypothetical protein
MIGKVHFINEQRGLVCIRREDGTFSILKARGDDVDIDEELRWRDDGFFGPAVIRNHTRSMDIGVFFQAHRVLQNKLMRMMQFDRCLL